MVVFTQILGYAARQVSRNYLRGLFMDSLRLHVKGGVGGMGLPRFGGIGGRGGHVYLVAKEGETLKNLSSKLKVHKIIAGEGGNSSQTQLLGKLGEDMTIPVPPGVSVITDQGVKLGELNEPGSKLIVAKGGIGGCRETGFSGQKGEALHIHLDLKLIADACLVGFPNAGKSTLLKAVSRASPKIASYPFTTLRPHIGIMQYKDLRQISVADLPGLIEGAHVNIGMGHRFLKHVERTQLMIVVVDIQGFRLSPKHLRRNCLETIVLLNKELELYKPDLLNMPAILVVNKMDTENATEKLNEVKPLIKEYERTLATFSDEIRPEKAFVFEAVLPVALRERNVDEIKLLKEKVRTVLDLHAEKKAMKMRGEFPDSELIEKLKQETMQRIPTLV
ncbi:GTP-binding protein 10 homolog [Neodiprion virginianus]|uniref:GTP-binding protein 10 homolog n=1 Tax=Neodiprion fabricii TaxID=2872261 RepID=UPI001ED94B17|nr:GTP-binding protein 10 homolog [Neodiprion fabricii]XP_046613401.1 GTP-binding protein 10 homolog [Neodiprion virginianus]